MLALSQTTGYAILALGCIQEHSAAGWVLAKDIAASTGIPAPYLSKILHSLTRAGLLLGKRGYRGGFALARPPRAISVLDIAEAVEGPWQHQCLLGLAGCSDDRHCPAHDFWRHGRMELEAELRRMTLLEVAEFERRQGSVQMGYRNPARQARHLEQTAGADPQIC